MLTKNQKNFIRRKVKKGIVVLDIVKPDWKEIFNEK